MDHIVNGIKQAGAGQSQLLGTARKGVVQSYNPNDHTAKVLIQPEGTLTGWLQVSSPFVGPGWGIHIPLKTGEQVLVVPTEGSTDAGVIVGRMYSDKMQPPSPTGDDIVIKSSGGATWTLSTNGHVKATDPAGSIIELTNDGNATFTIPNTLFVKCQTFNVQATSGVVIESPLTQISQEVDIGTGPLKVNGETVTVP